MKPHLDISHRSTMGDGKVERFGFDEKSIGHLMSVLTDLYSDPELAVIREYSTNAWDSHRSAGITDPIEVELPTALRPIFVARDHGTGLSLDEVMNHLTKYGWSSKRESDNEVGMLGLGFKSALTYTSQFTVKATKNGMRATVLVTRDKDGCGAIQVVDTVATSDRNGVEVQVPVRSNVPQFNEKAHKFFSFWDPGTVLVNGHAPASFFDPSTRTGDDLVLDPDLIVTTRDNIDHDYIVMGNVAYPIDWGRVTPPLRNPTNYRISSGNRIVARVPIGTIDFTPSREALHLTERSIDVLESVADYVRSFLVICAQQNVDDAPNSIEAMERAHKWATDFPQAVRLLVHEGVSSRRRNYHQTPVPGTHLLTYKYTPVPMYLDFDSDRQNVKAVDADEFKKKKYYYTTPDSRVWRWACGHKHWIIDDASDFMEAIYNADRNGLSIPFRDAVHKNTFFVYGYTKNGVTGQAKLAIRDYLRARGVNPDKDGYGPNSSVVVFFMPARVGAPWISDDKFISWETLSGKKAPKRKPRELKMAWNIRNVNTTAFRILSKEDFDAIAAEADTLLYLTPSDYETEKAVNRYYESGLDWIDGDKKIFVARIRSAQVKMFHDEYPNAQPFVPWVEREARRLLQNVNRWSLFALNSNFGYNRPSAASMANFVDQSFAKREVEIDDPDLRRMIRCYQNGPGEYQMRFLQDILREPVVAKSICSRWNIDYDGGRGPNAVLRAAARYVDAIFSRYPLVKSLASEWGWRRIDDDLLDHLVRYVNQVHDPTKFTEMVRELKSPTRRNLP